MIESEALQAYLVQARQCYDELEQALVPMRDLITDLEQDWNPRDDVFWQRVTTALAPLRQTVNACLALYRQERSTQAMSASALFSAASIEQSCVLFYLGSRIEEVGIRLTSYRHRASFAEKHLRQRQWVLQALRDLDEAGQKVLQKGRTWIAQVLESQRQSSLLSPSKAASVKRRRSANKSSANTELTLRLVDRQETEEGPSDPASSGSPNVS